MLNEKKFYYKFKPLNVWLFLNLCFALFLFHCGWCFPSLLFWWQMQVLIGTCLFSWGLWIYKYLFSHLLAVIDDEKIKIDHCEPLYWTDVDKAEEKFVQCDFRKYPVIILVPKSGLKYQYNFLQKHNGKFTAFSLPLYPVISRKDAKKLETIVAQKVKLKKLKRSELKF